MVKCKCGAEGDLIAGHSTKTNKPGYFIMCKKCDYSTHIHETVKEAEKEWEDARGVR